MNQTEIDFYKVAKMNLNNKENKQKHDSFLHSASTMGRQQRFAHFIQIAEAPEETGA